MKLDHILAEAHQHLGSALPVDATVDIRLAGKIVCQLPVVGDGVANKHDSILARRRRSQRRIGLAIAFQLPEVIGVDGNPRRTVLIEAGETGGGDRGGGCWARAAKLRRALDNRSWAIDRNDLKCMVTQTQDNARVKLW